MKSLKEYVLDSGWRGDFADVINLFVGGSELHGAKISGTDDHDIYGVYIEKSPQILGIDALHHEHQHFVWSTAGDDRRNTADDVDITLFSLQKWAYLACKGNVTKLHFLFAVNWIEHHCPPEQGAIWKHIREHRQLFLAKSHLSSFSRFAEDQMARVQGLKGQGKKGHRREEEAQHGFDTKAAMHAVRILFEAEELLRHGTLTLPGPHRDYLVEIRKGKHTLPNVVKVFEDLQKRCIEAAAQSQLPEGIHRERVSQLIAEAYQQHWSSAG
jgi:predicted nucleotidyltransferase